MMPKTDHLYFNETAFDSELKAAGKTLIPTFKKAMERAQKNMDQDFSQNLTDIKTLIQQRSHIMDTMLTKVWYLQDWTYPERAALIAVGGYGRSELHPQSDIDILVLLEDESAVEQNSSAIESFITFLWDIGLNVGHGVRTIQQCQQTANDDLTVMTNLMEARTITGETTLLDTMNHAIEPDKVWPSEEFFLEKRQELLNRHSKYENTEYNLEPNVKGSPGGLRDIQTIAWIAKRHFGVTDFNHLVTKGFLTTAEAAVLKNGQTYIWKLRYGLHMLAHRPEDRLLLDFQHPLAELLGYRDTPEQLAVEQLMSDYYQVAISLAELTDIILQHFEESVLDEPSQGETLVINERFQVRRGLIEVSKPNTFRKHPHAILEIFLIMAQEPSIQGARASTIRLLRSHYHLIDESFRQNKENTQIFLDTINCGSRGITSLMRMARYGVLGQYLPEFGNIIGVTQHDLLHVYTVDTHTMHAINHIRTLYRTPDYNLFPIASDLIQQISNITLLYIATLYHDLGMIESDHHAEAGAELARSFCKRHRLNREDTNLVVWLVRNHQLMTRTAQRKDISDPDEVVKFVERVQDQKHLDYLYLLTVTDITTTNPKLWTSWRASLVAQLYISTTKLLQLDNYHVDRDSWIQETKKKALSILNKQGIETVAIQDIWSHVDDDYFLREKSDDIAWHTSEIYSHKDNDTPLVSVKTSQQQQFAGGTQIFIYTTDRANLFSVICIALELLNLDVLDARIMTSAEGYTFDTFVVQEANGTRIDGQSERAVQIKQNLLSVLDESTAPQRFNKKRTPRQYKFFNSPTQVILSSDIQQRYTVIEVITPDRTGLLALISNVLLDMEIHPVGAKILTLGEKVEDFFYVTNNKNKPIASAEDCYLLQQALKEQLDQYVNT